MSRHPMSQEFDPRIADWLEDDPDDAPGAVLETVLAAFPSIPQRRASRVPWRSFAMNRIAQLGAVAGIALLLAAGLVLLTRPGDKVGSGPAPSPSAVGSASSPATTSVAPSKAALGPLDKTFTSARYGYSVDYPGAWSITPASLSWTGGTTNMWGSGLNDELKGADIRFSGASEPLETGQTADQWLAAYANPVGALSGSGNDPAGWPTVAIGTATARIDYDGGPAAGGTVMPGGRMFDAVVVGGGQAYNFNMDGNVDRATFEAFLATVALPDIPTLDTPYTSARFGYSVQHPAAWAVTPGTKTWSSGYAYEPAATDTFGAPGGPGAPAQFVANSTRIPTGMTFDAWYAAYDATRRSGTCASPSSEETIRVDGAIARLDIHCPTFYFEAVVEKSGRAYVFTVYAPQSRPVLEEILATVRLTPATAKN